MSRFGLDNNFRPPQTHKIIAVLGPTNTGKTHLAVERMLAHSTGMIGLPLRLLAREIYDRIIRIKNPSEVALITGEERIVPAQARYFVCTVEAMPRDLEVEFLAVDEIQLAADPERGHIFTRRIMYARGTMETMLLGAGTMARLVKTLLPDVNFITRPRFSKLSYAGQKKITRLPQRSAIVAFNAENVYAIAELIRRQRGGAAVVMGALSPRTRNAQVELYQSGDVDFIVATDAIGMGLNMEVNHVAFAATKKFDGLRHRELRPAELAQIAGRAGRHMNDGTFGVTDNAAPFEHEIVEQIEAHEFELERVLQWRNHKLDFDTPKALLKSLNMPATGPGLVRTRTAVDVMALEGVREDPKIRDLAASPLAVRRLWEVCQLPDYRNLASSEHVAMVAAIYRFLMDDNGVIPNDWLARQLDYTDRADGDIDTLANRISHIRTWTYVANRSDWVGDPAAWRERTKAIEDKLSDALHERLTQRFIDRRTSVLVKRLKQKEDLKSSLSDDGGIFAEDQYLGRLRGFHFIPDMEQNDGGAKALRAAALKVIGREIEKRAAELSASAHDAFAIENFRDVLWQGHKVARLEAGGHILKPRIVLLADDQLSGPAREAVNKRLGDFVNSLIERDLEPLVKLDKALDITGLARGFAFRLVENFGILKRADVAAQVTELDQDARKGLRKYGVRFGAHHIFLPAVLKPAAATCAVMLWSLNRNDTMGDAADLPKLPGQGLTSAPYDQRVPRAYYATAGFLVCGNRAVRIDMIERLADLIRPRIFWKPENRDDVRPAGSAIGGGFSVIPDMMSLVGCSGEEFEAILRELGYQSQKRKARPEGTAKIAIEPAVEKPTDNRATPSARAGKQTALDAGQAAPDGERTQPVADTTKQQAQTGLGEKIDDPAGRTADDFFYVWLPRKAKPARSKKPMKPAKAVKKPPGKTKTRARTGSTTRTARPANVKRADIASSPFAALEVLRKSMKADENT